MGVKDNVKVNRALTYGASYLIFKRPATLIKDHAAVCSMEHPVTCSDSAALNRFRELAGKIKYRNWIVHIGDRHGVIALQIEAQVIDVTNGLSLRNYGPKHFLCPNMDNEFLLDVIFNAIKEVELHEIAEQFYFDNVKVYCPHGPSGEVI